MPGSAGPALRASLRAPLVDAVALLELATSSKPDKPLVDAGTQGIARNDQEFQVGSLLDQARRQRVLRHVIDHDVVGAGRRPRRIGESRRDPTAAGREPASRTPLRGPPPGLRSAWPRCATQPQRTPRPTGARRRQTTRVNEERTTTECTILLSRPQRVRGPVIDRDQHLTRPSSGGFRLREPASTSKDNAPR